MESCEILPGKSISKDVGSASHMVSGDHKGTFGRRVPRMGSWVPGTPPPPFFAQNAGFCFIF